MWSKSRNQAAKELAPVLAKESSKTTDVEWLRYRITLEQISEITGFELTNEQAEKLKSKLSEETSQILRRNSVCKIKALEVRTDSCHNVTLIKTSEDRLILDWTNCCSCSVGKTIDFDVANTFWTDDYYSGYEGVFYAFN